MNKTDSHVSSERSSGDGEIGSHMNVYRLARGLVQAGTWVGTGLHMGCCWPESDDELPEVPSKPKRAKAVAKGKGRKGKDEEKVVVVRQSRVRVADTHSNT